MPECDKGDHNNDGEKIVFASKGKVKIPDQPLVEAPMPHPPKAFKPVVVKHTSTHIVNNMNTVHLRPELSSSPDYKELEPDED